MCGDYRKQINKHIKIRPYNAEMAEDEKKMMENIKWEMILIEFLPAIIKRMKHKQIHKLFWL